MQYGGFIMLSQVIFAVSLGSLEISLLLCSYLVWIALLNFYVLKYLYRLFYWCVTACCCCCCCFKRCCGILKKSTIDPTSTMVNRIASLVETCLVHLITLATVSNMCTHALNFAWYTLSGRTNPNVFVFLYLLVAVYWIRIDMLREEMITGHSVFKFYKDRIKKTRARVKHYLESNRETEG